MLDASMSTRPKYFEPFHQMIYKNYIREHPDKNRCDFTKLFADKDALTSLTSDLCLPFEDTGITMVAAVDALGFVLGSLCANKLGTGLALIRKGGKTAWDANALSFEDYSGKTKTLEITSDALSPADQVLIVDDWSETGAQLQTAIHLIESTNAKVIGAAMLHIDDAVLGLSELSKYRLHSVEAY